MVTEILTALIGSGAVVTLGGWIFQNGNRLTALEAKEPELKELISTKFDGVYQRLDRMERILDNGFSVVGEK